MLVKAKELNGHHIGAGLLTKVIVGEGDRRWNEDRTERIGNYEYGQEYRTISMITHKKNGDVNVRAGADYLFEGSKEVDIKL